MGTENIEESTADLTKEGAEGVRAWLRQIDEAGKREKDWRVVGRNVQEIYEGCKESKTPFNILFSNTDTLLPALYNNTPRPVVQRRFRDADPIGAAASKVGQRMLEFYLDPGETGNTEFDSILESAVLDALLPGRGCSSFTYEAQFTEGERVIGEQVVGEYRPWDNFLHGFARRWVDVPWIAYEHFMTRDELKKNFDEAVAKEVKLTVAGSQAGEEEKDAPADSEAMQFAHVWEIWDKEAKKVRFISPGYPTAALKEVDDPLQLEGFFNCPAPLRFMLKNSSLVPTALYTLYETQAKELNNVTTRINKVIGAMKVRGFYDSTLEGLDKLMSSDDNTLIPAENVAAMLQGQTLEKAIWLFPIEKLTGVLQQLYLQRQQVKTVIYEITGISDILRGSTAASETATAQTIKNKWGTLRLKRMQKAVMTYVRSCLRIVLQLQAKHFDVETIKAMTGLSYPTEAEKQQAQMALQQMQQQAQQQAQQAQMMAQMTGQPPQPQQPPPPPSPELLAAAQSVTWEQIKHALSDDLLRGFKVDIETNSTVDSEATEDKENMGEFMNALSQFMNGIAPLIKEGILPFEAAQAMLMTITRRYRFGPEVEDELAKMKPPPPPEDPNAGAAKAEEAKLGIEMKKLQGELQVSEAEGKMKMDEMQMKMELAKAKHQLALEQLSMRRQEMIMKAQMPQAPTKAVE